MTGVKEHYQISIYDFIYSQSLSCKEAVTDCIFEVRLIKIKKTEEFACKSFLLVEKKTSHRDPHQFKIIIETLIEFQIYI